MYSYVNESSLPLWWKTVRRLTSFPSLLLLPLSLLSLSLFLSLSPQWRWFIGQPTKWRASLTSGHGTGCSSPRWYQQSHVLCLTPPPPLTAAVYNPNLEFESPLSFFLLARIFFASSRPIWLYSCLTPHTSVTNVYYCCYTEINCFNQFNKLLLYRGPGSLVESRSYYVLM